MARATKRGLDYFPMDIQMEDKIKLVEAKYGIEGFGIIIRLYQKIYANGYFIDWNEENVLLFSNEINIEITKINEIIEDSLNWQLFDRSLYENYFILTSHGIQVRYKEATYRRKQVKMIRQYNLLTGDEINVNVIYVDILTQNVNINRQNVNISTQSKVKKSKVKKSKVNNIYTQEIEEIFNCWLELLSDINNPQLTKKQRELITTKLKKWDKDKIIDAIQNYHEVLRSDYYYSHNFTFHNFIKQSNGVPRFIPGLDQKYDGDIWKDYQSISDRKNKKTDMLKKLYLEAQLEDEQGEGGIDIL